jgi:hypothetical protein
VRPLLLLLLAGACGAQDFHQRGFVEWGSYLYPQDAPGDSAKLTSNLLLRYEASYKAAAGLVFYGSIDGRADTHCEVERRLRLSWWDREARRPALAVRSAGLTYTRGHFTVDLGKQLIRWGKADLLNPTDHFAPRDYLNVEQSDYLPVTAARVTYGLTADTFEIVYTPRFTPSRVPLLDQRWAPVPEGIQALDGGGRLPGGPQFGARWNHTGSLVEYSLSIFDGFNHLPALGASLVNLLPPTVSLTRLYPRIRSYGAEAAVPLKWFTVKSEAAYFGSPDRFADEYALYVVQLERQAGEWFFTGGYAGEKIIERRSPFTFAPDRGLTHALLGRAGYTIDTNRSVAMDVAVRETGDGSWLRLEYSQTIGQHWRATASASWIRGDPMDFLGQYHLNSNLLLTFRYSF